MRVAIVGFPYSGKTTLFRAITGLPADHLKSAEENLAAVHIPEPRLDYLQAVFKPKKRTEATIDFVDLPGSAEGDVEKAGLEKHLPTLRQADALVVLLRAFESGSVTMHEGCIDPERDLRQLRDEMLLADFAICSGRIEKLEKAITKPTKERDQQKHELEVLKRCEQALEHEKPLSTVIKPGEEEKMLRSFGFLTQKPMLVVLNVGEDALGQEPQFQAAHAAATLAVCAPLEADLIALEPADRPAFMKEYGMSALARDRMVRTSFDALGMISMLTAGEDECRAWPLVKGATAVEAAGKIHSDLARGFIKAETISYEDFRQTGSMREAKAANKIRMEPKGYVVQDGDIMNIKFAI